MALALSYPPIKWAQRKDRVFLTVDIRDIKNEKINLTDKELHFQGESGPTNYEATIALFGEVDTNESKWNKTGLHLQFILIKKDKTAAYWKRLTLEDKKNANIAVDWSKYVDEDEEESEGNKGIGGGDWDPSMMNRFGGGGPGEEMDSDDEEDGKINDLEKEEELPGAEKKEEKKCEDNCGHDH